MITSTLLLLAGLALIIQGGSLFVAAAVRIAEFLRMPRVVIGSTLVSLATTSPELVVSIMSGLKGESGLAVGNAVGSCICNIGFILGTTAALKQIELHTPVLRTSLIALLVFGVTLFLMTIDLQISRTQGALLLLGGLGYFAWDFYSHWRNKPADAVTEAMAIEADLSAHGRGWFQSRKGTLVQFFTGAALVVLGSELLVNSSVTIAKSLGVPIIVIGLTIVAIGTSLPEFITALSSSRQSVSDLAVGNIIGANIANLSIIVGAAALIHSVQLDPATQTMNFVALLCFTALLFWALLTGGGVTRRKGAILLLCYALYLGILTAQTLL